MPMGPPDSTRYPTNPSPNTPTINCRGCGVELDPSEDQVNTAVDQVLETSLRDAEKKGGVCPLCGHSKEVPYSNRKTVLFGLLLTCLLVGLVGLMSIQRSRRTQRAAASAGDQRTAHGPVRSRGKSRYGRGPEGTHCRAS